MRIVFQKSYVYCLYAVIKCRVSLKKYNNLQVLIYDVINKRIEQWNLFNNYKRQLR